MGSSSFITSLALEGRWVPCLALLRGLRQEGLEPDLVCSNALLDALRTAGQWRWSLGALVKASCIGLTAVCRARAWQPWVLELLEQSLRREAKESRGLLVA